RPTRLSMHNFMPYRNPTELELDGIRLACLAGENGHGKSAIIDAITWALWGEARSKSADELIHLGEEQMEVSLDFRLSDQEYRVIRQRDSAGRGSSTLEFQVGNNGNWTALTEHTIKETQERIESLIGMDYSTFINSALLLQGRADEFTNQPPGKRKEILGAILRLDEWGVLEERAKAKVNELMGSLNRIEAKEESIREELEKAPEYESHLEAAASEAERLGAELKEAQHHVRQLQEKQAQGGLKRQGLDDTEAELEKRGRERDVFLSRIRSSEKDDWPGQREEISGYEEQLREVQRRIAGADPEAIEHCQEKLGETEAGLAQVTGADEERRKAQEEKAGLSEEKAGLTATNTALKADMAALKEEMDLLERADANCPLCDSELTEEHRQEILASKQVEGEAAAAEYKRNKGRTEEIDYELGQLVMELSVIDKQIRVAQQLQSQRAELTAQLAKLEAEQERLEDWKAQVIQLERAIEEAKTRYEGMKRERIAEWQEQAHELEATIASLTAKRDALKVELGGLAEIETELRTWKAQENRLGDDLSRANLRVGAATQKIEHCHYLRGEAEKLETEHNEASSAWHVYDQLKVAFGKKGIQAMIIETVIPEIEEEANRLLEQMTGGRMSVRLDSQRETKKGTVAETLDIHVSDELGTRSYDLFSGGEAFRINFAIRIAISKLLARRAGARLETLIIDEGFGSQDAQGREKLVEAISSVAGDFGLILVVTHLDELKEAFPSRIEVVKGPAGSLISVN
ncbi:MAG TPA: SMC family ATPase, partial [Anaerolineae bacterium]|nr:SMC family ATPase [Anaerolineae bacterium]